MSKLIDLTGQKFGRLTVLRKDTERLTKSGSYWICQCECGTIKSIRSSSLRRGEIQSCGCLRTERSVAAKEALQLNDDLIGQRFGFLTVVAKNPKRGAGGAVRWDCICDCGNRATVQGNNLKRTDGNQTISCGKCYHISIGEKNIKEVLDKQNVSYIQEYVFPDFTNHRYDFALIDKGSVIRLIEFDGEQHFKETYSNWEPLSVIQARDKVKNEYAISHNIPLARIPYWERDKITLDLILSDKYLISK